MRILIAEDDVVSAKVLRVILTKAGHQCKVTRDGVAALEALQAETFDVLLTDWMMPRMHGISLIREARKTLDPVPVILMVTALALPESRQQALDSGADDYVTKPYLPKDILTALENGCARKGQSPTMTKQPPIQPPRLAPSFRAICLTASTGGPPALTQVMKGLTLPAKTAVFIVLHSPAWGLELFAKSLARVVSYPVYLAEHGMQARAGSVYVAPGDRHLEVVPGSLTLKLTRSRPENFVRPAADVLFRTAAAAFGSECVAVVLTGIGSDGTMGAAQVSSAGGVVLVQDPNTAVAPGMPDSILKMDITDVALPLDQLPAQIEKAVSQMGRPGSKVAGKV